MLDHSAHMIRISLYIFFAMAIQICCYADVTKLSVEYHQALQDSSRFHEVRVTTNLPPAVVALCADDSGRLMSRARNGRRPTSSLMKLSHASPSSGWNSDGECVVHYERGGRGHSFHVLVATFIKGDTKPKDTWRGVGNRLKDYSAFSRSIEKRKLDDSLDYAHAWEAANSPFTALPWRDRNVCCDSSPRCPELKSCWSC